MTLEVVGAIAIASMIWNIYNLVKICLLENKIYYQKGQIEALIRREPTQTNAKNNALDVRLRKVGKDGRLLKEQLQKMQQPL